MNEINTYPALFSRYRLSKWSNLDIDVNVKHIFTTHFVRFFIYHNTRVNKTTTTTTQQQQLEFIRDILELLVDNEKVPCYLLRLPAMRKWTKVVVAKVGRDVGFASKQRRYLIRNNFTLR